MTTQIVTSGDASSGTMTMTAAVVTRGQTAMMISVAPDRVTMKMRTGGAPGHARRTTVGVGMAIRNVTQKLHVEVGTNAVIPDPIAVMGTTTIANVHAVMKTKTVHAVAVADGLATPKATPKPPGAVGRSVVQIGRAVEMKIIATGVPRVPGKRAMAVGMAIHEVTPKRLAAAGMTAGHPPARAAVMTMMTVGAQGLGMMRAMADGSEIREVTLRRLDVAGKIEIVDFILSSEHGRRFRAAPKTVQASPQRSVSSKARRLQATDWFWSGSAYFSAVPGAAGRLLANAAGIT